MLALKYDKKILQIALKLSLKSGTHRHTDTLTDTDIYRLSTVTFFIASDLGIYSLISENNVNRE